MKISRSSWHYRLYRFTRNVERGPGYLLPWKAGRIDYALPSSLCPYAWATVLGLVGVAVLALALAVAAPFYGLYLLGLRLGYQLARIPRRAAPAKKQERPSRELKERRPSLAAAFVRARKERVCPMIELVD